jgi:hypothetical protein
LEINNNYYYAIDWITIRGSCSCYGHAKQCLPGPNEDKNIPGMVNCCSTLYSLNPSRVMRMVVVVVMMLVILVVMMVVMMIVVVMIVVFNNNNNNNNDLIITKIYKEKLNVALPASSQANHGRQ